MTQRGARSAAFDHVGLNVADLDATTGWVDAAVATYDGIGVLHNNASTP